MPAHLRKTTASATQPVKEDTGDPDYIVVRDIRGLARQRVVRSFDFDERKLGNVEPIPMFWVRYRAEGFPHFLSGRFDFKVGCDAPPSFYMGLKGGSIAYTYRAQNIPVHIHSDYLISIYVRPDRLVNARASVSVFYNDRNGRKLPETERFSQLVGGPGSSKGWQQVTVELPGGYAKARQVGLTAWVVQPSRPSDLALDQHSVYRQDINAGAWFDDIKIIRLPRASLTTGQGGNVFEADQEVVLSAEVSDPEGADLSGQLEVLSADGQELLKRSVRMLSRENPTPELIKLGNLKPGLYRGRLSVWSGKLQLCEREVRFVKFGPRLNVPGWRNERFGLILGENDYLTGEATSRLIKLLYIDHVKLPIGSPETRQEENVEGIRARQKLLERLWQERVQVVATLSASEPTDRPGQLDHASKSWQSLLIALAQAPDVWRPYLAKPLVRHAGFVQVWQVGGDQDDSLAWNTQLSNSLPALGRELKALLPSAEMAAPWPILHQAPAKPLESTFVSLFIPSSVRHEEISSHIADFKKTSPQGLWAVIQPLAQGRYERVGRMADLTKRLVSAHAAGVEAVFLQRPWDTSRHSAKLQIEPREELLVFRTVAELLSRSRPSGKLFLEKGIHARMFDRKGAAVMVAWDDTAPPGGRPFTMYLGAKPVQIDMWGQSAPLPSFGNRHTLLLKRTPTFVRGMATWHLKLRSSFSINPPDIESAHRLHERTVEFVNTRKTPISGVVRLIPPKGWDVRPARLNFSLAPDQKLSAKVRLRFPSNEIAGPKTLAGQFIIDSDESYRLTAHAPFSLGLDDFLVRSFARVEGSFVIVQQSITNRSKERVDIEGYVLAPGRGRQVRMYRRLEPGQTIIKKYVLDDAKRLRGRTVRVGLKEIRGPRLLNQIALVQ